MPTAVELWHGGKRVARHERCYSRQQKILDLEHYLDVLRKKPGALAGSTPLAQWRQAGRWPACFDQLWQALNLRHGRQEGTRQMIELLSHSGRRRLGPIAYCRRTGAFDWAVRMSLRSGTC